MYSKAYATEMHRGPSFEARIRVAKTPKFWLTMGPQNRTKLFWDPYLMKEDEVIDLWAEGAFFVRGICE
jgi:hypothetical protein